MNIIRTQTKNNTYIFKTLPLVKHIKNKMDRTTMELYLMIGCSDEIIKYLKKEGIKTKKAAIAMMSGAAASNAITGIGLNTDSGFVNSSRTARRVIAAFED